MRVVLRNPPGDGSAPIPTESEYCSVVDLLIHDGCTCEEVAIRTWYASDMRPNLMLLHDAECACNPGEGQTRYRGRHAL